LTNHNLCDMFYTLTKMFVYKLLLRVSQNSGHYRYFYLKRQFVFYFALLHAALRLTTPFTDQTATTEQCDNPATRRAGVPPLDHVSVRRRAKFYLFPPAGSLLPHV